MWDDLPSEVRVHIVRMARRDQRTHGAALAVQRAWTGYRTRVLLGRFRMLRYLREFLLWNPSATEFMRRARRSQYSDSVTVSSQQQGGAENSVSGG